MQNRAQRTSHTEDDRSFTSSFPASVDALVAPRQDFSRWLSDAGIEEPIVSDLSIVFSELTSNAAAVAPDDEPIEVCAWCEGDDVVLSVENPPPAEPLPAPHLDLDDALRSGGRGLMIARAFTDSLEATTSDGGRLVMRCRRGTHG